MFCCSYYVYCDVDGFIDPFSRSQLSIDCISPNLLKLNREARNTTFDIANLFPVVIGMFIEQNFIILVLVGNLNPSELMFLSGFFFFLRAEGLSVSYGI